MAEHVEKIVVKFVGSVNPGDDDCFEESNPQKAQPRGTVRISQLNLNVKE